ncbi:MAG: acetylglutamate kinase [Actinomycetota bacterium]|nr:acetylglutamate kinase [Actinomycetota bacterium]
MTLDPTTLNAAVKAGILVDALPYIRRFWGQIVVVKYGGHALESAAANGITNGITNGATDGTRDEETATLATFAQDIVLMCSVGMRPLVVHGGGPQIGELMARLGKVPEFRHGLRVTDAETLDIARMVLVGKVNREIVSAINVHAPIAVGVSGEDAGLIVATQRSPELGYVGDVTQVNPAILERLLAQNLIPVVATIGSDVAGQAYNINADTAAGAIAEAVGAAKLVYLTDVEGIRRDRTDPSTLISSITVVELESLLADGTVNEGMIPKVASCLRAIRAGVHHAHILDGRAVHALLLEIFTNEGYGTMVSP